MMFQVTPYIVMSASPSDTRVRTSLMRSVDDGDDRDNVMIVLLAESEYRW